MNRMWYFESNMISFMTQTMDKAACVARASDKPIKVDPH